jgi:hypothetical protein
MHLQCMWPGFRAKGCTPSLLGECAMWGSNLGVGSHFTPTLIVFQSLESTSFSLDAFKPFIVFQSIAEGVDPRHLTTL